MIVTPTRLFFHNGRLYSAGEKFELDDIQAADGILYGILNVADKVETTRKDDESVEKPAPKKKTKTRA